MQFGFVVILIAVVGRGGNEQAKHQLYNFAATTFATPWIVEILGRPQACENGLSYIVFVLTENAWSCRVKAPGACGCPFDV
jgi:hypothetical protein